MGFISNLKMLLRKCDSFKTNALLRYREEPEFQSVTGGLVSVMVVIAFTGIFTQTILNTIAKDYITASRKLE